MVVVVIVKYCFVVLDYFCVVTVVLTVQDTGVSAA